MKTDKKKILLSTLLWGFLLWLFGYILGIVFFAFVPGEMIGWFVLPLGLVATLWVLFKKIARKAFMDYLVLGIFWLVLAVVLDYFFIVQLFQSTDYYKPDVYLYYFLTLALPTIVGFYKLRTRQSGD
jgi:hypothetical protein